jgi:hypothetical protein
MFQVKINYHVYTFNTLKEAAGFAAYKVFGGEYFDSNNILWRWVGNEFVGKRGVQIGKNKS